MSKSLGPSLTMELGKRKSEAEEDDHFIDFESSVHSRLLVSGLARLREDSRLCDVVLVAEGTRISAHRVVLAASTSYFKAMFTNDMAESRLEFTVEEIEMPVVNASALEALVNFCYFGRIKITSTNVWDVLPTSCLLQLNEVQEQCDEFLEKELNAFNCLKIQAFADTYACAELLRCASEFILHNFKDVIGTDDFYRLPGHQLIELISSEELQVPSQEQVFNAVAEWVRFDLPARQQLFPQLLEHVRLQLCDPEFLVNTVSNDPLVNSNDVCRNFVDNAKKCHILQLSTHERPNMRAPRTRSREVFTGEILYVVGGFCDGKAIASVERLDPRESNPVWQCVTPMSTKRAGVGVAVFDSFLYAVGGGYDSYDGRTFLESVERFDPATEAWSSDVALMHQGRWLHGVATLDGFIYAVGGRRYGVDLDAVERYDPPQNRWTSVASMGEKRSDHSVSVLNGCLYAVGGSCESSVERFDPRVGKWEHIRPMTSSRTLLGSAVLNGHLYAAGGRYRSTDLSSVEKYNPLTNKWTAVADMREERAGVALAVANGRLYAVGGYSGSTHLDTVEVFDAEANQWIIHSRMNGLRSAAGVGVLPMSQQSHQ